MKAKETELGNKLRDVTEQSLRAEKYRQEQEELQKQIVVLKDEIIAKQRAYNMLLEV